jgi:hypothetical protein
MYAVLFINSNISDNNNTKGNVLYCEVRKYVSRHRYVLRLRTQLSAFNRVNADVTVLRRAYDRPMYVCIIWDETNFTVWFHSTPFLSGCDVLHQHLIQVATGFTL